MNSNSASLLVRYLQEQENRGKKRVWLSQEAVDSLRSLSSRPVQAAYASSIPSSPSAKPSDDQKAESVPDVTGTRKTPAAAQDTERKRSLLRALEQRAQSAKEPRALGTLRETMVFAVGNPDTEIVFVGEAPGHEEERRREPFVGPAGQLLDKILKAMGLERSAIYISNICKFRPMIGDGQNQGMKNRRPEPQEMDSCIEFVREEIEIIRPKVIVALGGTAMEGLLGISGSVRSQRGLWHDMKGIPLAVTYHPSYLLRNDALSEKRKVWEDMLMVMEKVGMPISDKQRGFFKK